MQVTVLRQLSCCSIPRPFTSLSASTSCQGQASAILAGTGKFHACPHPPRQHQRWQLQQQQQQHYGSRSSHVARITGTRQEYDKEGIIDPEEIWGEDADNEYIEVENIPIYDPDQGGLNVRVFPDAEDEQSNKEINLQDTAYWCADNNGGELPRSYLMKQAPLAEPQMIDELLPCPDEEGMPERLKWQRDLEDGDELAGIVTDLWLWHGILVDVLADMKGLVPVRHTEWGEVQDELLPGTEVVVKVHKLHDFPKYRFPIQLELIEPAHLRQHIMKPEQYVPPANVGWCYDQGWDIHQVAAELGRHYEDQIGVLEPDHGDLAETRDYQFGHDAPDGNPYPGDWMSRELAEPGLREVMFKEVATTPGEPSSWGI